MDVAPPKEDPPKIARLRTFLNRSMRILITDGRTFEGQLLCIDNSKNIILANSYEMSPPNRHAQMSAGGSQSAKGSGEAPVTATEMSKDSESTDTTALSPTQQGHLEGEKRYVGLIMVPGPHIVKAEVDTAHLRVGGISASSANTPAGRKYDADYLMG
ncbi:hypothetical protein BGW42_002603 [Actinomortierella wolfii]|nr:hypothetical protein BGW42_002603 [Actinomortierella wolfii]